MNSKYKVIKFNKDKFENVDDFISIEEPLEISIKYNHDIFNEILKKNSIFHGINYHNLNKDIENFIKNDDHIFVDRVHLTDYGYEVISKIISDKI